jgi:hypothetical protein
MTFNDFLNWKLNILLLYSFIAQHQLCFYKEVNLKLKIWEISVIYGRSENCSIIQFELGFSVEQSSGDYLIIHQIKW